MMYSYVILHQDCPAILEGRCLTPPKFAVIDFSEDGLQTRLQCASCGAELTLTCHTADNPSHALHPPEADEKDGPHGAERSDELHPPG